MWFLSDCLTASWSAGIVADGRRQRLVRTRTDLAHLGSGAATPFRNADLLSTTGKCVVDTTNVAYTALLCLVSTKWIFGATNIA